MKETLKYALAIGITAAAMFAYMYEAPPRQAVHELAQNTSAPTTKAALAKSTEQASDPHQALPQRELSQAELADIDPASIDWEAMKERYQHLTGGSDAMLSSRSIFITDFSPEEIAAYNKLHVVAFNPSVGERCALDRFVISEEFGYEEPREYFAENCLPVFERPKHPYTDLSVEELRELVELNNDAEAAVFASRNASNDQERIGFAIQAAALSGKSGPLLKASRYIDTFVPSEDLSTDEVMNEIANVLIIEKIAALMGDPRALQDDSGYLNLLAERGLSQEEIQRFQSALDELARENLKAMGEMQRELTGATGILELTNA